MAVTARVIWLCACVRYWPDHGVGVLVGLLLFRFYLFYLIQGLILKQKQKVTRKYLWPSIRRESCNLWLFFISKIRLLKRISARFARQFFSLPDFFEGRRRSAYGALTVGQNLSPILTRDIKFTFGKYRKSSI